MELEQSTNGDWVKSSVWSSVWAPEFDMKQLKKAEEHIGRKVVNKTIKMKTMARMFLIRKRFLIVYPEKAHSAEAILLIKNTVFWLIKYHGICNNNWRQYHQDFSIAIDETVDITGIAQLAVFIRASDSEFNIYEELIELVPMHDTTTCLWFWFEKTFKLTVQRIWLADIIVLLLSYKQEIEKKKTCIICTISL